MSKQIHSSGDNVVPMPAKPTENRDSATHTLAAAGSPDDPRMKEAMRLMQAFLAIEDAPGRAALITLAERLVSDDWVRRAQRR
ncbi:MAG TPA: hypothetical protein VGM57_02695 [Pseudolabrys sp.]